jgi:AraC-like DNA-binding protein
MESITTRELSKSGDPSERRQRFKTLDINILCCRYWWFEYWKGEKMAFPFWRLYWNKNEGAYVFFERELELKPDCLYLIAPNTPFSNSIRGQQPAGDPVYFFKCGKIESEAEEQAHGAKGHILHFFSHFTLGYPYGNAKPGVYELALDPEKQKYLQQIQQAQFRDSVDFPMVTSLQLHSLITASLVGLPTDIWGFSAIDPRIRKAIDFMQQHIEQKITRDTLAKRLFMTPSAFSRLFQKYTGQTPSKYLLALRLEQASHLLLHTHTSIEGIAQQCGFVDRYHLTKVFTSAYNTSPAAFRKGAGYF